MRRRKGFSLASATGTLSLLHHHRLLLLRILAYANDSRITTATPAAAAAEPNDQKPPTTSAQWRTLEAIPRTLDQRIPHVGRLGSGDGGGSISVPLRGGVGEEEDDDGDDGDEEEGGEVG